MAVTDRCKSVEHWHHAEEENDAFAGDSTSIFRRLCDVTWPCEQSHGEHNKMIVKLLDPERQLIPLICLLFLKIILFCMHRSFPDVQLLYVELLISPMAVCTCID